MGRHNSASSTDRWQRHPLAGFAVRCVIVLVPFLVAIACVVSIGRAIPKPHGPLVVAWFALVCGSSWGALWVFQRWLGRLLPLAVLLEMALVFPDRAPSRADLARRAGSNRELRMMLENSVAEQDETVQQAAERVLALVGALARHDRKTRGHAERVRALTDLIAERMGLSEANRDRLRWAALLHDIGKLRIPSELLNKTGQPTADEWKILKLHPEHGARIIAPLMHWLNGWGDVVAQHHERWDGTGYPRGLAGTRITLGARIVAVADAYDVMTSNRAYKKPIGRAAALRELTSCSGSQFDPTVVRAMLEVPGRRLVVALGPLSWISGIPLIGQTSAVASGVASQAGAALGAAAVAGTATLGPLIPLGHDQNPTPPPAPAATTRAHVAAASANGLRTTLKQVAQKDRTTSHKAVATETPHPHPTANGKGRADPQPTAKPTAHPTGKPTRKPTAEPTPSQAHSHPTKSGSLPAPTATTTPPPTAQPSPSDGGSGSGGGGGGGQGSKP